MKFWYSYSGNDRPKLGLEILAPNVRTFIGSTSGGERMIALAMVNNNSLVDPSILKNSCGVLILYDWKYHCLYYKRVVEFILTW